MRLFYCLAAITIVSSCCHCESRDVPKATLERVSYGSHPLQFLKFWKAEASQPTAAVFFVHGGSWINGSPNEIERRGLQDFLKAGISVISIEYRKISDAQKAGIKPPVKWPMDDVARALQFVRSKAVEWNIDKKRIGASGVSAGACSVLWLAMHDDLADSKSNDSVSRESTRVLCVGVADAQTSLDPEEMRQWIPNIAYGAHAFGFPRAVESFEQFYQSREKLLPWISEYSPMAWISRDDPPTCCAYATTFRPMGRPQKDPTHAPAFGIMLKEKLETVGVWSEVIAPGIKKIKYSSQIEFLIDALNEKIEK